MNSKQPVFVYVEDDESSVFVMKMVIERVMGSQNLHVLQSSANFMQWVKGLGVFPDLFMLDIQMKPYDGFELLAMLRNDPQFSKSKVVAVTASVMSEQVTRLKQCGFDGAISKPLNIDVFPQLVTNIIKGESVWYIT